MSIKSLNKNYNPKYDITTIALNDNDPFILSFYVQKQSGRVTTMDKTTRIILRKNLDKSIKFLYKNNTNDVGLPILKEGDWELFETSLNRKKNLLTVVKNILEETNGRIVVRGRKTAKR